MTTLTRYRPRRWQTDPFFADFDTLVRDALGTGRQGFNPAVETSRDGDDAIVRIELPGVDVENDVNVEVVGNRLVVSGERRDEKDETSENRRIREFRYGSFTRSFGLPSGVTADAVTASYDTGILTVRVAGVHREAEKTRIAVTTGDES